MFQKEPIFIAALCLGVSELYYETLKHISDAFGMFSNKTSIIPTGWWRCLTVSLRHDDIPWIRVAAVILAVTWYVT